MFNVCEVKAANSQRVMVDTTEGSIGIERAAERQDWQVPLLVACVASVFVEQRAKKQGFRRFARAKNGARAKIRRRGWGRGRKKPLAAKHCDFQILRSPANGAPLIGSKFDR